MRNTITLFGIFAAFAASAILGQSVDEFDSWMRTIDEKNQSVQRAIADKDAATAAADAKTLEETFKLVEAFWIKRGNAPEAVHLSQQAQQFAAEAVKSATQKDFDEASTETIKIAGTCTACHRLYRPL
jgi:cytochrome c556